MFKIAEASPADIPTIIDIAEKTWWPAYSKILPAEQIRYMLDAIYSPVLLEQQMTNQGQTYLLLTSDDQAEAFTAYGPRAEDASVYKIHKIYVLPRNQKKGYGQALIESIKGRAFERGIRVIDLNVNRFNPARNFYEKLGFVIIREEDVPVGPYWMNDYVMRLKL